MQTAETKFEGIANLVPTGQARFAGGTHLASIGGDIVRAVLAGYHGDLAVRLWDGRLVHGAADARCTIIFREPGALRELVLHRNLLRLADCYLSGAIDVEGDLESLFPLKDHLQHLKPGFAEKVRIMRQALRLPAARYQDSVRDCRARLGLRQNSRSSIAHHYDVSNSFYRVWLDPQMVYSCAYFRNSEQSLEDAQRDKLDYLCRKLRLQPGQSLLDIGCGWGALAIHAARRYGVRVHGITLSREQQQFAVRRVHEEGLDGQVSIELLDYRDLAEDRQYDRVVSVGMFEHVGIRNFPVYFGTVRRVLKPDGLFLNHGITSKNGWERTPLTRFMNRYVFPDGELARISHVVDAMEKAGFETLDVESLRRHYVLTLRRWVRALERGREEAIRHSSEMTWRLWRLYMAGCAFWFREGSIGLYQVLAGHRHRPQPVPLRRDDLYAR